MSSLESQNAVLRQAILVSDRLADACLQGTDVAMLVSLAADFLGRQVVILDPALRTRAEARPGGQPATGESSAESRPGGAGPPSAAATAGGNPLGWQMADPRVERLLSTLCDSRRPMRVPTLPGWRAKGGTVVAPIAVGDLLLGYLAMMSDETAVEASPTDEVELLTISHLSTIYALALTRERREQEGPNGRRAEVLSELLAGSLDDQRSAAQLASSVGLPSGGPLRLLVAEPDGDGSSDGGAVAALHSHLLDELATRIEQLLEGAVAVSRHGEIVVLVPEPPAGTRRQGFPTITERLTHHLDRPGPSPGITVGVSSRCQSLLDLGRTYRQTRLALELAQRLGRHQRVVDCDGLGAYRLLLQLGEADELRSFATELLGPLLAYDRRHGAELLSTLAAFLDHHGRALPAARALYVHVNTVSYRLRRIEALAGLDLADPDDRLMAHVALKIVEGLGPSAGAGQDGHGPSSGLGPDGLGPSTGPGSERTSNGIRRSLEPSSNDRHR